MRLCKHVNTELVHSKAALCFPFTPIPWQRTRYLLLHGRSRQTRNVKFAVGSRLSSPAVQSSSKKATLDLVLCSVSWGGDKNTSDKTVYCTCPGSKPPVNNVLQATHQTQGKSSGVCEKWSSSAKHDKPKTWLTGSGEKCILANSVENKHTEDLVHKTFVWSHSQYHWYYDINKQIGFI